MRKKPELKICPFSNVIFTPKRNNQVFATSKDRQAYHNEKNNFIRNKISEVNKQLLKYYKILDSLLEEHQYAYVHKQYLKAIDFSFKLFTYYSEYKGNIIYGFYDIKLMKHRNEDYFYITRI
ncbi:MAG: hypothetical protein RI980_1637 [Bacteroidota bacterium]|jgi:hypothetical protein|nr:MAG: hypothetical protein EAZ85_13400 [Bacteroidota bacterium]